MRPGDRAARARRELAQIAEAWGRRDTYSAGEQYLIKLAADDWIWEETLAIAEEQEARQLARRPSDIVSRTEYIRDFRLEVEHLVQLTDAKNANYAGEEDAWQNFRLIDHITRGSISTEAGIITRMTDKFQRIANLVVRGAPTNYESALDNCDDLAIYTIILKMYLKRKAAQR